MNKVDLQIDSNLKILYEADDHSIMTDEIVDPGNDDYLSLIEAQLIADKLESKGLLTRYRERLDITDLGIEISKLGGWLKYKEYKRQKADKEAELIEVKNELETRNLALNNENLEYQKSNRELEKQITLLQKENLKLQNMKLYFTIGSIIAGFITGVIFQLLVKL